MEYAAIDSDGNAYVSKGAIKWSKSNTGIENNLSEIIWNGKRFVVLGSNGTVITAILGKQ